MGRPPGKIKTFPRVVELLTAAVKEKGQKTIEAETKLSQSMISRYLKGEGEPSQATLEKLAAYFKVSVAWLRGEKLSVDGFAGEATITNLKKINLAAYKLEQKYGKLPELEQINNAMLDLTRSLIDQDTSMDEIVKALKINKP